MNKDKLITQEDREAGRAMGRLIAYRGKSIEIYKQLDYELATLANEIVEKGDENSRMKAAKIALYLDEIAGMLQVMGDNNQISVLTDVMGKDFLTWVRINKDKKTTKILISMSKSILITFLLNLVFVVMCTITGGTQYLVWPILIMFACVLYGIFDGMVKL